MLPEIFDQDQTLSCGSELRHPAWRDIFSMMGKCRIRLDDVSAKWPMASEFIRNGKSCKGTVNLRVADPPADRKRQKGFVRADWTMRPLLVQKYLAAWHQVEEPMIGPRLRMKEMANFFT